MNNKLTRMELNKEARTANRRLAQWRVKWLIEHLSAALSAWLKSQATEEEVQEDGTVKQKMGKASLDILNKLKSGSKTTIQKLKDEGSASRKFGKDNFDLITWFIIS